MINKSMLTLVHPFLYESTKVGTRGSATVISEREFDDFLPYVSNFFSGSSNGESRTIAIDSFTVEMKSKLGAKTIGELPIDGGKIYFLTNGIGILTLTFKFFYPLEEADYAATQRAVCRLDSVNSTVFRMSPTEHQNDETWLSLKAWLSSMVAPYLTARTNGLDPFNPFNRSSIITSSILAVDGPYPDKPAFMEALLLSRKFDQGIDGMYLADSVNRVRQSESVESFGNSSGMVYLCRDDGSQFTREGVFNTYGRNYQLMFLITVYQQARIQTLIEKSSRLIAPDTSTHAVKDLKAEILTYLARNDFTQISNNPARNLLYKFFRSNFELKELLEEVSTIIRKIDQDIEAERAHGHADKAHKGEIIALILELLILPYYLHHIIELVLKYAEMNEHSLHHVAFWVTFGLTIAIIVGIQVLLRAFRK